MCIRLFILTRTQFYEDLIFFSKKRTTFTRYVLQLYADLFTSNADELT